MSKPPAPRVRWAPVSSVFGSALPYGSCNALVEMPQSVPIQGLSPEVVCGFPRRADGTCTGPYEHGAPPTSPSSA